MANYAVILAAGYGTRMNSQYPKCLYPLLRKPMIEYILDTISSLEFTKIITVIGYQKELFENLLNGKTDLCYQGEQYGTKAAAMSASSLIVDDGLTLIIPGDKPLITKEILEALISTHITQNNDLTIVTTSDNKNDHYGRIVRDGNGNIIEIKDPKYLSLSQKNIQELNTSIYCINNQYYSKLINNDKDEQSELLLTDIVNIGYCNHLKIGTCFIKEFERFYGVNDFYDLSRIENFLRMETNKHFMKQGIYIINPETVTISSEVKISPNVTIHPNTYITGNTIISSGAIIGPNTEIHNAIISNDSVVKHSLVYDSKIGKNCSVGPFAHLRNNTIIDNDIKVGNFVEVKNSRILSGTKASHLTYIGDAKVGKNVNFGCGTITVNYDGKNKYQTLIGNNVFIGCNSNLIAPVHIDDNAYIAAGSTITTNVPKNSLSIARSYQVNKEGYASKYPYYQKFQKKEDYSSTEE